MRCRTTFQLEKRKEVTVASLRPTGLLGVLVMICHDHCWSTGMVPFAFCSLNLLHPVSFFIFFALQASHLQKLLGEKKTSRLEYLESDKVGWNWSPWQLHWDESDWLTDVLMMDGWRTPLQWLAQTRGQSTRMPVSISVYCDIHKFPCYANSSCHVARLGMARQRSSGNWREKLSGYYHILTYSDIYSDHLWLWPSQAACFCYPFVGHQPSMATRMPP